MQHGKLLQNLLAKSWQNLSEITFQFFNTQLRITKVLLATCNLCANSLR